MNDKTLIGAEQFINWLQERGFTVEREIFPLKSTKNNWIASKPSDLNARRCEHNNYEEKMLLVLEPYIHPPLNIENCSIRLCGQVDGEWFLMKSYGIVIKDLMNSETRLQDIENKLIKTWNVLKEF